MRNDTDRWAPPAGLPQPVTLSAARLSTAAVTRQTLISGPRVQSLQTPALGWPDIAQGTDYRLSLRRDRVVVVNGPTLPEGWDDTQNIATSDISDAFTVFDLDGPTALDLLKRGTEISLNQPSASVARRLFGFDVWLYRFGSPDRFRIHIARAYSEALIATLTSAAKLMPDTKA